MQLSQVTQAASGKQIGSDVAIAKVAIDARQDCKGAVFFALKGTRFDAHDYIAQAEKAGAVACVVERLVDSDLPQVLVGDTQKALADVAAWWRRQFTLPVIAVTGSVGKTTVKEMLAGIFAESGQGVVTEGNLNNEIGVPLTLFKLGSEDEYAIVEMGMNHMGEIQRISTMAKPSIALINNAGAAHLAGLGSVQAVAQAKGEIFNGLCADGVAVIPHESEFANYWRGLNANRKVFSFGFSESADIYAIPHYEKTHCDLRVRFLDSKFEVTVPALGRHAALNALAAVAVSLVAGRSIKDIQVGLAKFHTVKGRLYVTQHAAKYLIDDSYNANPMSMSSAIDALSQFDKTLLIVGDMAELGEHVQYAHRNIGAEASAHNIDAVMSCGQYADESIAEFTALKKSYATQEQLLQALEKKEINIQDYSAILVKGSRSSKMENVVSWVQDTLNTFSENTQNNPQGECHVS